MDHDLRWIREQLEGFGERKGGFRYPAEFRRRALRYMERRLKETTTSGVERELTIPWATLKRWKETSTTDDWSVEKVPGPMVPVHVTGQVERNHADHSTGLSVQTPSGWRVEGLSFDQAVELLARCS